MLNRKPAASTDTTSHAPSTSRSLLFALLAALSAAPLAGCLGPDHIEVEPQAPRLLRRGETMRLRGKVMDRAGKQHVRDRAFWSSSDPSVASVTEQGDLTAVGSGHAVITARAGDLRAEVPVEVDLIEGLEVQPRTVELKLDAEPLRLAVTAVGKDGQPRPDRAVSFRSADPAVVRVDPEGRLWALEPGDAKVRAKVDEQETEIVVHVGKGKARR